MLTPACTLNPFYHLCLHIFDTCAYPQGMLLLPMITWSLTAMIQCYGFCGFVYKLFCPSTSLSSFLLHLAQLMHGEYFKHISNFILRMLFTKNLIELFTVCVGHGIAV